MGPSPLHTSPALGAAQVVQKPVNKCLSSDATLFSFVHATNPSASPSSHIPPAPGPSTLLGKASPHTSWGGGLLVSHGAMCVHLSKLKPPCASSSISVSPTELKTPQEQGPPSVSRLPNIVHTKQVLGG